MCRSPRNLLAAVALLAAIGGSAASFAQETIDESRSGMMHSADMMNMMQRMQEMMGNMERMMAQCNEMMTQMQRESRTDTEGESRRARPESDERR